MPPVVAATLFPDVFVLEPARFKDNRGEFLEVFNAEDFEVVLGITPAFVQDNVSVSRKNTVRGLHWQAAPHGQGKLVICATGTVFDVIVDIRPESPAFLTARTVVLSGENRRVLWIPAGYAHGFAALEDNTTVFYKVTHKRVPAAERTALWCDPALGIQWPVAAADSVMSEKDRQAAPLRTVLGL